MTSRIGLLHKGDKPIWQCAAQWANHLATVGTSLGHSHIQIIRSSCDLRGKYTDEEADAYSTADIPLEEETWAPYLRNTVNSHQGDGVYTEIIVNSGYNIWAMLQNLDGLDKSANCIIQDHMHLLTTAT